jgi:hypothetical protein
MKLTAILAATILAAGGAGYGLYTYTDLFGEKSADLSSCPVAKTGGCPHCNRGTSTDAAEVKTDSCCATPCAKCTPVCDGCPLCEVDCSLCCAGSAGVAAAGPVGLFPQTSQVKAKAGSCCADKAVAKKPDCCPNGACCPDGPCCGTAKVSAKKPSCCPDGDCCPTGPCCATAAVTGTAAVVGAAKK